MAANNPDTCDYEWLVEKRYLSHTLLLRLYRYPTPFDLESLDGRCFQLLVGTAFSLWRAVFLVRFPRNTDTIGKDIDKFLKRLVRDNSINYSDELNAETWTVGYYLNSAGFRLSRVCDLMKDAGVELSDTEIHILGEFKNLWDGGLNREIPDLPRWWEIVFLAASSALLVLERHCVRRAPKESSKYALHCYWSEADSAFIIEVPELAGCMADGATYQEALANVERVIQEWIDTALELGRPIPEPRGRLLFA